MYDYWGGFGYVPHVIVAALVMFFVMKKYETDEETGKTDWLELAFGSLLFGGVVLFPAGVIARAALAYLVVGGGFVVGVLRELI
jgi:hypothetical protein